MGRAAEVAPRDALDFVDGAGAHEFGAALGGQHAETGDLHEVADGDDRVGGDRFRLEERVRRAARARERLAVEGRRGVAPADEAVGADELVLVERPGEAPREDPASPSSFASQARSSLTHSPTSTRRPW